MGLGSDREVIDVRLMRGATGARASWILGLARRVTGPSGQGTAGGDVCVEYVLVVGHSNGYCGWYHRIL